MYLILFGLITDIWWEVDAQFFTVWKLNLYTEICHRIYEIQLTLKES